MKIAHDHIRRMTARGWRSNAFLIFSFLAILTFLGVLITESGNADITKVHNVEYTPELPEVHIQNDGKLTNCVLRRLL